MFDVMLTAALSCFSPLNFLAIALSTALGIIMGALPGFGATTGLIIVLPLTYSMEPGTALITLTGVYVGAEYGGSISSILLNTPGTAGAVVTCFDGFPMAQKGKPREALFISNIASFSGGIVGGLVMLLFMPLMARFALKFGAGEILVFSVMGLLLVGIISKGDPFKGIFSAALGVLLTCVGIDPFYGLPRFDFDNMFLAGGFPIVPIMLGFFSTPYMIVIALETLSHTKKEEITFEDPGMRDNVRLFFSIMRDMYARMKWLLVKSGLFGVGIGAIPGVGGNVATMVAYSSAKASSKHPEEFGTGIVEGIAAPESSNNGIVGGSLIPVLTLGIPGTASAAIFMGAIFMHGMVPGPNFMVKQADLVYLIIMAIFVCALMQLAMGILTIGHLTRLLRVPAGKLFPAVIVVCCIGSYVVRGQMWDIYTFLISGIIVFLINHIGFNAAACMLGMLLGNCTELSLLEAMTLGKAVGGLVPYFLTRPIALAMLAMLLIYIGRRLVKSLRSRPDCAANPQAVECIPGTWKGMRGCDLAFSVICLALVGRLYVVSYEVADIQVLFPRIILGISAASLLLLLIKSLFMPWAYYGCTESPFAVLPWGKLLVLSAPFFIYIAGISYIGFYTSSIFFTIFCTMLIDYWKEGKLTRRSIVINIAYSVLLNIICYIIFKYLFLVNMPTPLFI